jgi:2-keto-4-pentenoate hydratase/2-oxohepta-3-ene-1,7-dioic acid hydratase in catechol pathway
MVVWRCRRRDHAEIRAVSIGPCVATPDGFDPAGVEILLRVDGRIRWSGRIEPTTETMVDLLVEASGAGVRPGQIIGAGTCQEWPGTGSGGRIHMGSIVEVEVRGLGILRTTIGGRPAAAGAPAASIS